MEGVSRSCEKMAEKPLSDALALSLYGAVAPTLARRGELGKAVVAYQKLLTVVEAMRGEGGGEE